MNERYRAALMANELLASPNIEMITVDADVIRRAEREIESCEHCNPDGAEN
jgi:hypothetical protein